MTNTLLTPPSRYLRLWHSRGPEMEIAIVLRREAGRFIATCVAHRHDNPGPGLARDMPCPPGATEDQAIMVTDKMFTDLYCDTARLGDGWSKPTRTIIDGDIAALVATLKSMSIDESLFN